MTTSLKFSRRLLLWSTILMQCLQVTAQGNPATVVVTAHLRPDQPPSTHAQEALPSAVLWLKPLNAEASRPQPRHDYTVVQKNRMFSPHLLVIPVGSVVSFPNKDPFFHNVFSLFDGKRFDLGLYEAGSTREVTFSREGVSYIFCNIHSQMSAVILSLSTPLYSIANAQQQFRLDDVPPGSYELHIWIEGEPQTYLEKLTRHIQIVSHTDLGTILYPTTGSNDHHTNKFNQPYDQTTTTPY